MKGTSAKNIYDYIANFPEDVQQKLQEMRAAIKKAAPKAEEAVKYAIPTFVLNGNLVHFAAFKNHIGFYPAPRAIEAFKKELAGYEGGKGTIQFPFDKKLPLSIIAKIVRYRIKQAREKEKSKNQKK